MILSSVCVCLSVLKVFFVQMEEKKKKNKQSVRTDYWLQPNIVVKVVTKRLGEKYHKKKAVVMVTMLCVSTFMCTVGKRKNTCVSNSRGSLCCRRCETNMERW